MKSKQTQTLPVQNSASDFWDLLMILQALKGLDCASSSALSSVAHTTQRLGNSPTSPPAAVLEVVSTVPFLVDSTGFSSGTPTLLQSLSMTLSILSFQLMKAALSSMASHSAHSAKPHLLSMTSSCHQNHSCLKDSYTWPSSTVSMKCSLGPLWDITSVCLTWGNLLRFHSNNAGLFWITASFSTLANQHQSFPVNHVLILWCWSLVNYCWFFSPSWLGLQILNKKKNHMNESWRIGSEVKNTCSFCRGPGFNS